MTTFKKLGRVAIPLTLVLLPMLVFAASFPNPTSPVSGGAITLIEIQNRIEQIASFLIIVGVILAVIFIIWGGITYMVDAEKGKARLLSGIIGAAVVLGVGVILQTLAALVARTFFS